eukprot:1181884-Prorocentrum_minimum.AAC.3
MSDASPDAELWRVSKGGGGGARGGGRRGSPAGGRPWTPVTRAVPPPPWRMWSLKSPLRTRESRRGPAAVRLRRHKKVTSSYGSSCASNGKGTPA